MVENYIEQLQRDIYGINIRKINVDSEEGSNLSRLYEIMSYPALIVTRDQDGQAQNVWQGTGLPSKDEVVSYMIS